MLDSRTCLVPPSDQRNMFASISFWIIGNIELTPKGKKSYEHIGGHMVTSFPNNSLTANKCYRLSTDFYEQILQNCATTAPNMEAIPSCISDSFPSAQTQTTLKPYSNGSPLSTACLSMRCTLATHAGCK